MSLDGYIPALAIPMRVDAIRVENPQLVPTIAPEFHRLPFFDGTRDVNSGVPYLGDAITPRPFQDATFELAAGVHLHWAIPAALRHAVHDHGGTTFPAVPNRWLVRRFDRGAQVAAWVVESDYLAPPAGTMNPEGLSYPVVVDPATGGQPFRYIGRQLDLARWTRFDATADYLGTITAVGYGDPAFAAYYPSCHRVFGFYDDAPPSPDPNSAYSVCGWYSSADSDFVQTQRSMLAAELGRPPTTEELIAEFAERLHLSVERDHIGRFPDRTMLYGEVLVPGLEDDLPATFPDVTIAPTAGEAVSTLLARGLFGDAAEAQAKEEQLDLVQLGSALDPLHVDVGFAFDEVCHQRSFVPSADGPHWRVVPAPAPAGTPASAAIVQQQRQLADAVAADLADLNRLQADLNRLSHRLDAIGSQVFADWQKFMIARYGADPDPAAPDPDRILDYLERHDLAEFAASSTRAERLENRVQTALRRLRHVVHADGHVIERSAGPRYWAAAEPFVLLSGEGAQPTSRLGRPGPDQPLICSTVLLSEDPNPLEISDQAAEFVARVPAQSSWNPFLLEWETEFFPVLSGPSGSEPYAADFLERHYAYADDAVDMQPNPGLPVATAADLSSGRSFLTAGPSRHVGEALDAYIWQRLVRGGYWAAGDPPAGISRAEVLGAEGSTISAWAAAHTTASDTLRTALAARELLAALPSVGQVLGGFNAGLLMHSGGPQLPIADPVGFREYRDLADRVRYVVGHHARYGTQPLVRFNPVRAGDLSLLRLRLIDTFGRSVSYDRDLAVRTPTASRLMPPAAVRGHVHLPPRLAQDARLIFRWLAASQPATSPLGPLEVNDHPLTSPICGWFTANHLDRTLMVFDVDGRCAGSILASEDHFDPVVARWLPAPGPDGLAHPDQLANRHLRRTVDRLRRLGPARLAEAVEALDQTLDQISPDAAGDHTDLALLVGRPFAVVRARLGLELKGRPAVDQSWDALSQALNGERVGARHDRDLPRLLVPVRVGEFRQLGDGLLGYWVEQGLSADPAHLRLAQIDVDDAGDLDGHHDLDLRIAIGDAPVELTMLIDPQGSVHASCGLLPTKTLSIPPEHYRAALDALELTFLAAPVLSPQGRLDVVLPTEAGSSWSWVERRGAAWTTIAGDDLATGAAGLATPGPQRLREGWLRLRPDEGAP